jgi:hypothetical protein
MKHTLKENVIAQLAYEMGAMRMYSGDHVADRVLILDMAKDFLSINKRVDWTIEDITLKVEEFIEGKKGGLKFTPPTVIVTIRGGVGYLSYQSDDVQSVIVDHDNAESTPDPRQYRPDAAFGYFSNISPETKKILVANNLYPEGE